MVIWRGPGCPTQEQDEQGQGNRMSKFKDRVRFLLGFFFCAYLLANLTLFNAILRTRSPIHSHRNLLNSSQGWVDVNSPLQLYVSHVRKLRRSFNCGKLFAGDLEETEKAGRYLAHNNHSFPTFRESLFLKVTQDCERFVSERGYYRTVTFQELELPVAFVLLTHGNIEELERLLRTVFAPHNYYCIHVDLKASRRFMRAVQSLASCLPNVFVATRLERVVYAHFSRLKAELNCIEDLLFYGRRWKYLVNLASSEFPLKSNLEIVHFLKSLNGSNDIREVYRNRRMERFHFRHMLIDGTIQKSEYRLPPPPHNLTVTKGLAYGAFSRKFLEFALTNQKARDFLLWCRDTHSPDEHFWATLNNLYHNPFLNSPGGSKADPDKQNFRSRFVVWSDAPRVCHGRYRHNICVFSVGDLLSLASSKKLIANKFDLLYDPVTYSCMEEYIHNKTLSYHPKYIT